jgi:hypothetical protein
LVLLCSGESSLLMNTKTKQKKKTTSSVNPIVLATLDIQEL